VKKNKKQKEKKTKVPIPPKHKQKNNDRSAAELLAGVEHLFDDKAS